MGSNPKKYLYNGKNYIYVEITEGRVFRKTVTINGSGGGTNGLITQRGLLLLCFVIGFVFFVCLFVFFLIACSLPFSSGGLFVSPLKIVKDQMSPEI